jgi:hypothetical protein
VGRGILSFGAIAMYSIPLEIAQYENSNVIEHTVIALKPLELSPNMKKVG